MKKLLAPVGDTLERCLPPSSIWAVGQIAVLLAAGIQLTLHVKLQQVAEAQTRLHAEEANEAKRPILKLAGADAADLSASFPPAAGRGMEALVFLEDLSTFVSDANLTIVSTAEKVVDLPDRKRMSWKLVGEPQGHVRLLSRVLRARAPIRIHAFQWESGDGPGQRVLELTVDFFFREADSNR